MPGMPPVDSHQIDLTPGRRVPDRAVLRVMTTFVPAENLQVARCLDLLAFTPDGPHSMHCVTLR